MHLGTSRPRSYTVSDLWTIDSSDSIGSSSDNTGSDPRRPVFPSVPSEARLTKTVVGLKKEEREKD